MGVDEENLHVIDADVMPESCPTTIPLGTYLQVPGSDYGVYKLHYILHL